MVARKPILQGQSRMPTKKQKVTQEANYNCLRALILLSEPKSKSDWTSEKNRLGTACTHLSQCLEGSWKWNLDAPTAIIHASTTANWPAVIVPTWIHLAKSPWVHNFTNPVSAAMRPNLTIMLPSPPAPALLTLERRPSAGWEIVAAATPATTPDPKETVNTPPELISFGDEPKAA